MKQFLLLVILIVGSVGCHKSDTVLQNSDSKVVEFTKDTATYTLPTPESQTKWPLYLRNSTFQPTTVFAPEGRKIQGAPFFVLDEYVQIALCPSGKDYRIVKDDQPCPNS